MLIDPRKSLCWVLLLALAGCQKLNMRSQNPDDDDEIKAPKTIFIADQVAVAGLHPIQVETVGVVTGLDNTGGDSPPSIWRTMAVDEMRRRGVTNPNAILASPTTALVIVRASLPPVIDVGDHFDVEVALPENTEATSLQGGHLMECFLSEQAVVPGRAPMKGHVLGKAEGPIMVSTGEVDSASLASGVKRGRVLGGGIYKGGILKKGRELGLYIRNDLRSVRQARRIALAIGRRFHYFDHGIKKPLSKAMTDQYIELKVHPRYKENYVRYVQVIRQIAINESPVEQRERMERLRKSLLVPQTAGKSAMELEAIGSEAILILKEGLKSPSAEVRFYSADSLAYLGDGSGSKELAAAARDEEAFRVFALAALATLDDPVTRELLNELMTKPTVEATETGTREVWSDETRYGAFRTLWTIDPTDDHLRGESMHENSYHLHVIKGDSEPLVHLTTHRVPQVVVYNQELRLRTPISLTAGRHIMITAPSGSDTVTISRFVANEPDQQVVCSTRLVEVIRAVSRLKATYPDVAQMLVQAERQSNLMGRLALDALPYAGRIYRRPASDVQPQDGPAIPEKTTRIGKTTMMPNMFPTNDRKPDADSSDDSDNDPELREREESDEGEASIADVSEDKDDDEKTSSKKRGGFLGLFR